jgi:hypothetical protein
MRVSYCLSLRGLILPLLVLPLFLLLAGCGGGKKKLNQEEPVTVDDFLVPFPSIKLPYILNDTLLRKKNSDSLKLSVHAWRTMIPDSLYAAYFADKPGLRLFAIGKVIDRNKGKYIFIKAVSAGEASGYLFYFDRKNKLGGSMRMATADGNAHEKSYGKIDNQFNISLVTEIYKPGGTNIVKESSYGLSDDGVFTLIMTNTNAAVSERRVYNPIDGLPRHFKWSGDYVSGKNNIVSLRDGVVPKEYRFFIHFVNEDAGGKGEVKGVAEVLGENKLKFTDRDGPCGIEFRFADNRVTIREVGGCGAYRDVSCFFEGTYTKKKPQKIKKKDKGNNL